jgi:hypothetical protein
MEADKAAGLLGSASSEGLGPLAPERAGQPRLMTVTPEQADNMHGHWYSPAAVREMLAAERERCAKEAEEYLTRGRSPLGRAVAAAIRANPPQ